MNKQDEKRRERENKSEKELQRYSAQKDMSPDLNVINHDKEQQHPKTQNKVYGAGLLAFKPSKDYCSNNTHNRATS